MGRQSLGHGSGRRRQAAASGRRGKAGCSWLPWRRPRAAQRTLVTEPSLSIGGWTNSEARQTSRQPPSAGPAALRQSTALVCTLYYHESEMSGLGQHFGEAVMRGAWEAACGRAAAGATPRSGRRQLRPVQGVLGFHAAPMNDAPRTTCPDGITSHAPTAAAAAAARRRHAQLQLMLRRLFHSAPIDRLSASHDCRTLQRALDKPYKFATPHDA